MGTDDLILLAVTLGTLAVAFGLAYWVFRAASDRSARVGLYLLFGIPGVLLTVVGAAFAVHGSDGGWTALAVGVGLCLPLIPALRRFVAAWTPMDSASPVDMAGLCVVLAVIGVLFASYVLSPDPASAGGDVSVAELLIQFLAEIAFAYILVGLLITRNFRQATARLGVITPTGTMIAVATFAVFVALVVVVAGGVATNLLQPDVSKEIDEATKEITSGVQNPIGAVFFGLGAGAGEELLLRGAIQPRYGLIVTSVLFALLHNQYGISFVLLSIFVVGLMLGLERKYFGTTTSFLTHAIFNTIVVLIGQK
ncbi:MAG TPA: CPBP family intramembrane glutamic endopeptidase [Thermomicrobiales bacterium]